MPCDYSKYPKNWKQIVKRELIRAGNKCELCGAPNHTIVFRSRTCGIWSERGDELTATWYTVRIAPHLYPVKIILTTHHIDGDLNNNVYPNLLVSCQRCHCRLDLEKHIKNAKATREKKKNVILG